MLTKENKDKRFASSMTFLSRYNAKGDELMNHIVIDNETCMSNDLPS